VTSQRASPDLARSKHDIAGLGATVEIDHDVAGDQEPRTAGSPSLVQRRELAIEPAGLSMCERLARRRLRDPIR